VHHGNKEQIFFAFIKNEIMNKIIFVTLNIVAIYSCKKEIAKPDESFISETGKGTISHDASMLSSGVYQYSLNIDGRLIDPKQMVFGKINSHLNFSNDTNDIISSS
jgi:hypothetical protein